MQATPRQRFRELLGRAPVYAVTDDGLAPEVMLAKVVPILEAGIRLIQFRDKSRSDRDRVRIGRELLLLVHAHDALLVVNDRADLAVAIGADGVHLGQDDLSPMVGRRIVGEDRVIGVSTSFLPEIAIAEQGGADYLGFGAVYPTGTKLDAE